jgi:hypothetical protein
MAFWTGRSIRDAKQAANVTRNSRDAQFTIERLAHDCLDIREVRRKGFLTDRRVEIGPSIRWPKIARVTIERYRIQLNFWRQATTQYVRVSWTKVHLGGARPWMHCTHCEKRVAKLYAGLGGYFCRACVGNPPYASQRLSAQGRAHFKACKLRLLLNGEAQLSRPFPERPRHMHRRTYEGLRREGIDLEAGLSKRMRRRFPDYKSLVAYTD